MSFKTELKAFGLEPTVDHNMIFNVKDITGDVVAGAAVTITSGTYVESGLTDANGCYQGNALPGTLSTLQISASGYSVLVATFMLIPKTSLSSPSSNFAVFVRYAGSFVSGATVTLTPEPSGVPIIGTTDSNGMFDTLVDHVNKLYTFNATDGTNTNDNFLYQFNRFDCGSDDYIIASVVTLS